MNFCFSSLSIWELYHWVKLINFSSVLDLPIILDELTSAFPLIICHASLLYYITDLLIFHFALLCYSRTVLLLGSQLLLHCTKMVSQLIVLSVHVLPLSPWVLVLQQWAGPLLLLQKVYSLAWFYSVICFQYAVALWWSITCYRVK